MVWQLEKNNLLEIRIYLTRVPNEVDGTGWASHNAGRFS